MVDKSDEGVTEKVLLEFDAEGEELICTQVLKLSDETWSVPEQVVPEVFVVTDEVSIVSEKVTEMVVLTETDVSESVGEVEATYIPVVKPVGVEYCSNRFFPETTLIPSVKRTL